MDFCIPNPLAKIFTATISKMTFIIEILLPKVNNLWLGSKNVIIKRVSKGLKKIAVVNNTQNPIIENIILFEPNAKKISIIIANDNNLKNCLSIIV